MIEEPEGEEQQDDGHHHTAEHQVELTGGLLVLTGTRLQLTILTGSLLKIQVQITVIVALGFIVNSRIGHAELFTDTCHQVGSLINDRVRKCLLQIIEGRLVIAYLTITGCQCTIGARYLIHITILFEEIKCILSQPSCQHVVIDALRVDELHGRHIVLHQTSTEVGLHQVF